MLVLSRKIGESICIGDNVTVQVVDISRDRVRLGITAPRDVRVDREEVAQVQKQTKGDEHASPDQGPAGAAG